ncbi:NfeD family protein [Rhodothermus profundi]|uniref:Membrane-bound serine protease (ClpP class) n=1 Tax=Rhodothermus profundi TaxID=633813 RepID=A0A1M6W3W7_9BACT|nr:nodulation protein NfeD [Rhodothermus profundi]SHK88464.1 membrane-bound serine protease (ClpP class) [Rhodothermus profundi]
MWPLLVWLMVAPVQTAAPEVYWLVLEDEPITPATVRFIRRGLREAVDQGAACLVIEMDTPGGLVDATRDIVQLFLRSPIPIVVYVSPPGARAASAGVFITLAAHVAAMAPGTHIGAAHPVQLGGGPATLPDTARVDPMSEKILNDAVAWARALAQYRGRNADWAARAVSESQTLTAREAVARNVVDFLAPSRDSLLILLDGQKVILDGQTTILQTADATVRTVERWWGERILAALSNPNIAFLLLMLGFYGLLFELYTPGWGIPGTLGAIFLMLGFYGLSILPVNYVGLALLVLGLGMLVAEAFVPSFGLLTVGGVVCLILGGLMLVESPMGFPRVSAALVVPVALATALIALFLLGHALRIQRRPARVGDETLIGRQAIVREDFAPEGDHFRGYVFIHGEWWQACSSEPVRAGQTVRVEERKGLCLWVTPVASSP